MKKNTRFNTKTIHGGQEPDKAYKELAEKMFREQEDIPAVGNINETGFMFENDAFELAENIGFTEKGVILIYNQYEISSYADGKKTLVIPFEKVKDFLTL